MGLHLFRSKGDSKRKKQPNSQELLLDRDPYGDEEQGAYFNKAIDSPIDIQERKQDMGERIIYADRAFFLTFLWVIFLMVLPLAQMGVRFFDHDGLTDPQFITVITTTTASVFGFWVLVGRYLFEPKNSKPEASKKSSSIKIDKDA